jgi:iron complex transport system ATP-binding protein
LALLDVVNLSFSYPRRVVFEEISLSLTAGEFIGFLGPNGSGKSTFLKNILGFLTPRAGKVLFAGPASSGGSAAVPSRELSHKERARRLAFVPQGFKLVVAFTVEDMVLMGRLPHLKDRWAGYSGEDRQKVRAVMEALGIDSMADRPVSSLSGGEFQKVIIARCLVQEGDIILLDEATSGLDLNHSIEIMELMRRKADEEDKIILAVLHDLNLASHYCDRIFLLKNGRLRYQGRPADVLSAAVVEEIYGIRAEVRTDEYGCPFVLPRRAAKKPTMATAMTTEALHVL